MLRLDNGLTRKQNDGIERPVSTETADLPVLPDYKACDAILQAARFRPPKGTWFDEGIDFRDPEGHTITTEVLERIEAVERLQRRRSKAAQRRLYTLTRKLIANALRGHFYRTPSWIAYSRKADGYQGKPRWLSGRSMGRTVDLIAKAGLVRSSPGERGTSSTYRATPELVDIAFESKVTQHSLSKCLAQDRLIRLRSGKRGSDPVAFNHTPESRRWAELLDAYNRHLSDHDIALSLSAAEEEILVEHMNKEGAVGGMPLCRAELIQTDLYRQFNNRSFGQGGRLYGGWWINAPKELRSKITIDGLPTVELDYSGCAIRMLYHERGLHYRDDPYILPDITAYERKQTFEPGHYRPAVKTLLQALINSKGDHPELVDLPNGLSFRPRFKRAEVRRMIEAKHAPIADAFQTGVGLSLQRKESDLALDIVTSLVKQGIVALPIHDSFIVAKEHRRKLRQNMSNLYKSRFGFYPAIGK